MYSLCITSVYLLNIPIPGAFGYFECTHDITQYTKAAPFQYIGKKTPMVVRFSTVGMIYPYSITA